MTAGFSHMLNAHPRHLLLFCMQKDTDHFKDAALVGNSDSSWTKGDSQPMISPLCWKNKSYVTPSSPLSFTYSIYIFPFCQE